MEKCFRHLYNTHIYITYIYIYIHTECISSQLALQKSWNFPQVYNDSPCAVLGLQGPVTSSGLNKADLAAGSNIGNRVESVETRFLRGKDRKTLHICCPVSLESIHMESCWVKSVVGNHGNMLMNNWTLPT